MTKNESKNISIHIHFLFDLKNVLGVCSKSNKLNPSKQKYLLESDDNWP